MTMTNNSALLSTEGILILCAYILTLIGIGWLGKKAQKEQSLSDFYLAGRGMSFFVLKQNFYQVLNEPPFGNNFVQIVLTTWIIRKKKNFRPVRNFL